MFGAWTNKPGICGLVVAVLGLATTAAEAGSVGYQVRIGGGKNAPIIRLINTSTEADVEITSFHMTVGDTGFNFDYFWLKTSPTMSYDMLTPDLENGGNRFDEIVSTFEGFGPGEWFRIKTDLDPDSLDSNKQNWHHILYDLGGNDRYDNAEFSVTFSTGHVLEGYLKDYSISDTPRKRVRYSNSIQLPDAPGPVAVPLPAAAWTGIALMGSVGGLGFARKALRRLF